MSYVWVLLGVNCNCKIGDKPQNHREQMIYTGNTQGPRNKYKSTADTWKCRKGRFKCQTAFFFFFFFFIKQHRSVFFFSLFYFSFVIFREALKKINSSSSASHMFAVLCIQRHLPIYCQKMLAQICIHFAPMNTLQVLCSQICSPPSLALCALPSARPLSHRITLVPAIVFLIASCTSEFGLKENID